MQTIRPVDWISVFWLSEQVSGRNLGLTPFAQAMPDYCKSEDIVQAYRKYYIMEKQHLAKWSKREIPEWWTNNALSIRES